MENEIEYDERYILHLGRRPLRGLAILMMTVPGSLRSPRALCCRPLRGLFLTRHDVSTIRGKRMGLTNAVRLLVVRPSWSGLP